MLVLTRKTNQSIMIGDDIELTVLRVIGEKVRLGIQAPRDVPILRKELYVAIKSEPESDGGGDAEATLRQWRIARG